MCAQYKVYTGNTASDAITEYIFIELLPPVGVAVAIKRISYNLSDTNYADGLCLITVYRETTAGSGGISFTPMKLKPDSPSAVTTAQIKTGTTAFTKGTTTDILIRLAFNMRGSYEWIARDYHNLLWSNPNERLIITGSARGFAGIMNIECDFIE